MGDFSDTSFRQAFEYISARYPMKALHTQWVINTHIQHVRNMLNGSSVPQALQRRPSTTLLTGLLREKSMNPCQKSIISRIRKVRDRIADQGNRLRGRSSAKVTL
jgi:hypothetical protein